MPPSTTLTSVIGKLTPLLLALDLEPYSITRLQLVSQKLQKLCLDDEFWKRHCFDVSPWYKSLLDRRSLHEIRAKISNAARQAAALGAPADATANLTSGAEAAVTNRSQDKPRPRRSRKFQDMANWDPAFPDERTSWYDEFIQRNGPDCVNWLQIPRMRDREVQAGIEVRGMALYNPYDGDDGLGTMLAVSPLDDGSVCLWDVKGSRGKQGGILARSKPEILFFDGPGSQNARRSKRIDTGVTECVSVNNNGHKAFFAVQGRECHFAILSEPWLTSASRSHRGGPQPPRCRQSGVV